MSAADLNLSTVELTSTLITAPLNGAPSSADYNDSQRANLVDLSTIVSFINNQILPLINALPAGALLPTNSPVGIQGATIWTNTGDQGQLFFDSLSSTPLTIYESFNILNGILTTNSQQLIDLGVEVASLQSLLASTNQNEISLALQNLSSSLSQLTVTQSVSNTAISSLQTEINTINTNLGITNSNLAAEISRAEAAEATKVTNVMTTTGDIIYSSPGSTPVRLGIGTTGYVLTVVGGVPAWAPPTGGGGGGEGAYATTIGDGSSTAFTITHNLGTEDVIVEVHNISSGQMEIVDVDIVDINTVTVTYGSAPALNAERVVVLSSGGTPSGTPGGSTGQIQWNNSSSFAGASNSVITAGGAVTLGLHSNAGVTTTALTVNAQSNNIVDFYSGNEGFVVASMLNNGVLNAQGVVLDNTINFATVALKVTGGGSGSPDVAQFWGQTGSPEGNVKVVWVDYNGNLNIAVGQAVYAPVVINNQAAGYTAALTDADQLVVISDGSAANFTIPTNGTVAFPVGTTLSVIQYGTGQVTLVAAGGVTIVTPSSFTTRAQYSTISVTQVSANTWVAGGDLT